MTSNLSIHCSSMVDYNYSVIEVLILSALITSFSLSKMAVSLKLAKPTPGPQGRRSDVAISENTTVRVFDSTFSWNLFYSVGEVSSNTESPSIKWDEHQLYGTGKHPSVALTKKDGDLYVIVVHHSRFYKKCYYRLGRIVNKDIEWIGDERIFSGVKPRVSATDEGKIVAVNEQSFTFNMEYHIGKLASGSDGKPFIHFEDPLSIDDSNGEKLQGVEPDITISENRVILIFRSGFHTYMLQSYLGTLAEDGKITWHTLQVVPGIGISPCISLNSHNYLVESHQTKLGRLISCNHGDVNPDEKRVIWGKNESLAAPTFGEYPAIALSNDGIVVESHKTNFGITLYQSCCKYPK